MRRNTGLSLDLGTLEFCQYLVAQGRVANSIGRMNAEKRAKVDALTALENLIEMYIRNTKELLEQK
jgi:hypothetical protein